LGDFFDSSSFGFIDPSIRGSFDGVANKPVSKRKELSEPKEPSTKRIKAEVCSISFFFKITYIFYLSC